MTPRLRSTRTLIAAYTTLGLAIAVLATHTFLAEEGRTTSRNYPPVPRPPSLLPREIAYLDWLDRFIDEASTHATRKLWRFWIMTVTAVVAGAAAVTSLVAGLPSWTTAALVFLVAASVGTQAVLRDQQCGLAMHAMAVEMQAAKREFGFTEQTEAELHHRFQEFRHQVESIKKRHGETVLKAMASPPPKLRLPISG